MDTIEIRRIGDNYYQIRREVVYGLDMIILKVWNPSTGKIIEESGHFSIMQATQKLIKICSTAVKQVDDATTSETIDYRQLG